MRLNSIPIIFISCYARIKVSFDILSLPSSNLLLMLHVLLGCYYFLSEYIANKCKKSRFNASYGVEKQLTPIFGFSGFRLVPLEKALEHVISENPEYRQIIQDAKSNCYYPSEHNLTRDESAAILLYTMETGEESFYSTLNETLRMQDRKLVVPWFPFLELFDTALNKLPTVKGNIWRGITGDFSESYKPGQVITWWNFSSCSSELSVVQNFVRSEKKSTLFMIDARNGRNIARYTKFPDENEILLPMGTKLLVRSKGLTSELLDVIHLVETEG
jgi:hypothetical protein